MKVREIKTGSGKTAVQVVLRLYHRTKIIKHIGTGETTEEISRLKILAHQFIRRREKLIPLFSGIEKENSNDLVSIKNLEITNYRHQFAYDYLLRFYKLNGFEKIKSQILKDLTLIRIVEPVSKIRSLVLLNEYFGKVYSPSTFYKNIGKLAAFKKQAEELAISYAKKYLNFNFSIVFYDVTTLYFETFKDDDLRKSGFSKDGKSNQPQILIALVVNRHGYPIVFNIFEGNKFEGHTIIPTILKLKDNYKIDNLVVVADAAMLSYGNLEELKKHGFNYIVAARLSSLPKKLFKEVSIFLSKKEGIYFKKETEYGFLICDYSEKRASKDKFNRNKQIIKAQRQIDNPDRNIKRLRFVREKTKSFYELNQELIKKDELQDGIKGYYTNLKNVEDHLIIERYKDLWVIEKSFRIAKSDLLARPIFHHKKESIEAHILIVFLALCVSKSIELKTKLSIKNIKEKIWKILDVEIRDRVTGRNFIKQTSTSVLEY